MRIKNAAIDRRAFLQGRAISAPESSAEIASILVQVKPERLADVQEALRVLPGVEVHQSDPRGKIIVVIEAESTGAIGGTLNTIALLPNVITASLVYHATDIG